MTVIQLKIEQNQVVMARLMSGQKFAIERALMIELLPLFDSKGIRADLVGAEDMEIVRNGSAISKITFNEFQLDNAGKRIPTGKDGSGPALKKRKVLKFW